MSSFCSKHDVSARFMYASTNQTSISMRSHEWARHDKRTSSQAKWSKIYQSNIIEHYCLYYATAPQQLNACWGDFPGKSPQLNVRFWIEVSSLDLCNQWKKFFAVVQGEVRVLYPHNAKNGASCLTRFLSLGARMVEPPIANFGSGWMWDRNELNRILKNFVEAKEVWNHLEPKKLQYLLEIYNTVGGILGSNAPILASRSCFY